MKEKKKKLTQSEIDGVQYRRAKLWQIICYACNAFIGMSVYSLIGMASYSASIGFGVATAVVGVILTCTRILDGITDPLLAFVYDRVNTKFGKIRILMVAGWGIEAIGLLGMFSWLTGKYRYCRYRCIHSTLCCICNWIYYRKYDRTDNSGSHQQ